MSQTSLVYPMAAMVLLTMIVLVKLFRARVAAVRTGQIQASFYWLYQGALEPEPTQKVSRHFVNLFEAPTLFYVACLAAMVLGEVSPALVTLAWCYVVARLVHAYVHLGRNRLRHRLAAYFASWLVLAAIWACLTVAVALRD